MQTAAAINQMPLTVSPRFNAIPARETVARPMTAAHRSNRAGPGKRSLRLVTVATIPPVAHSGRAAVTAVPRLVSYRSPAAVVYSRGLLVPERSGCLPRSKQERWPRHCPVSLCATISAATPIAPTAASSPLFGTRRRPLICGLPWSNRRQFVAMDGEGFAEIDNAWGRQGWTTANLEFLEREDFAAAVKTAWENSAQNASRRASKKKKTSR